MSQSSNKGFLTLALLAVAGGAAYAYSRKEESTSPVIPTLTPSKSSGATIIPMPRFPIRKGMRSEEIRNIQNAIIKVGGLPAMLIKQAGGADGVYGSGTEKALQASSYPTVIDEATYKRIIGTVTASTSTSTSTSSTTTGYKAVVDALFPAPIYASIVKGWSDYKGDKFITYLSDKTAVGRFLQQQGSMMLFETTIGEKLYRFWISKNDIELMPASLFDQKMSAFAINEKPADVKHKIVAFFA